MESYPVPHPMLRPDELQTSAGIIPTIKYCSPNPSKHNKNIAFGWVRAKIFYDDDYCGANCGLSEQSMD
jgi:hypothetical protein